MNVIVDQQLKAALNQQYLNQPLESDITKEQLMNLQGILVLENKGIKDLSGIHHAIHATQIHLGSNQIKDLSPLKGLKNIEQLNLSHNQIDDLRPLSQLKQLTRLDVSRNHIRSLWPLTKLDRLKMLLVDYNPLQGYEELRFRNSDAISARTVNTIANVNVRRK